MPPVVPGTAVCRKLRVFRLDLGEQKLVLPLNLALFGGF